MFPQFQFLNRINITQRRATLVILTLYFCGSGITVLIDFIVPTAYHYEVITGGVIAMFIFGIAWFFYYERNWDSVRYMVVLATILLVGLFLPEPYITQSVSMTLLLPVVLALLLLDPLSIILSSILTIVILLMRAGWQGIYTETLTLTIYGMTVGAMLVSRLISETALHQVRNAHEAIVQSEKRFSTAFHANPVPQVISNLETSSILDANEAFCQLLAYERNELIGQASLQLGIWVDPGIHQQVVQRIKRNETAHHIEVDFRTRSGEIRTLLSSFELIYLNDEPCLLVTAFNITERKRSEQALKESEERFRRAIQDAPYPIQIHAEDGEILSLSQAWIDLTGYTADDIPTIRAWVEKAYRKRSDAVLTEIEKLYSATARVDEGEELIYTASDEARTWKFSSAPLGQLPDGRRLVISMAVDVTELKQMHAQLSAFNAELEQRVAIRTEELNKANAELKYANRTKDEFLATMSHELRTPLNVILGMSETLLEQKRGSLNEKQSRAAQMIASSGEHLLSLINDILEVSKIEAGKLELQPDILSINEVCEASLNFIRESAAKKSIAVEYRQERSITKLYADSRRLKQILVNLLSNAVKFTPEHGKVTLQVRADIEHELIQFSVIDTGIGIASQDLKRLFQPFVQLDSSLSRRYSGTGLGLVLVYKFTELHGGSVEVESEPGKGSRFTILLPIRSNSGVKQIADPETPIFSDTLPESIPTTNQPGLILLVEDTETNIMVVEHYLQDRGYQVSVARNGLEALEKASAESPQLILMDIQIPELDGLQVIRQLRQDSRFTSTPIIALTALAMPGDLERCLAAGANEYLSKPINLKQLLNTVKNLLG